MAARQKQPDPQTAATEVAAAFKNARCGRRVGQAGIGSGIHLSEFGHSLGPFSL